MSNQGQRPVKEASLNILVKAGDQELPAVDYEILLARRMRVIRVAPHPVLNPGTLTVWLETAGESVFYWRWMRSIEEFLKRDYHPEVGDELTLDIGRHDAIHRIRDITRPEKEEAVNDD